MDQSLDCGYNYVVTAQKPTAVRQSVVGHFTSPTDINLIISKTTRIEIHTLADGLQGVLDVPIYGRIAAMDLFRPPGRVKDLLFFLTEQNQFSVVEFDSDSGELVTVAFGDASAKVGRTNENGITGIVDPSCKLIALHIYNGIVRIIPIDTAGKFQEAFDVKIDEICVLDLQFLHGFSSPTLAVLFEDPSKNRHLKTYQISINEKAFVTGSWPHSNLDAGATMVIPVPPPLMGCLVVGEAVITYFHREDVKTVALQQTCVRAFGQVDEDGSRFLLGDVSGQLYLLVLSHDGQKVLGLKLQSLGRTSAASSITYLDNAVVFIGSATGDSQLIRLHPQALSPQLPSNFVEVMDTFTNLGPIVDMCVVHLDRQGEGQGQVVTCSGAGVDGSLRVVRNGIGMVGQASVELPGIRGLWSLRASFADGHDSLLVLSFVGETRFLAINADDELEEADLPGFDSDTQTLFCGNMLGDLIVQVTPSSARLCAAAGRQLLHEWKPAAGGQINIAAGNPSQILVASGEGSVALLEVAGQKLQEAGHSKLTSDVACLDITPLGSNGQKSKLAAVGTWDRQVHLLEAPGLQTVRLEPLGGDVIPRSLLFARFDDVDYLLIALGDGQLVNFHLEAASGALSEKKKISLGNKPITLRTFRSNGASYVFAASDRPTIIYSSNQKLLYSNLNESEVNFMTPFNSSSFPDSLAIAKETLLTIGSIDEVQKLHISSIPLAEQPRRLCHLPSAKAFILITASHIFSTGLDDAGADKVRLLDEQNFEVLDVFDLETRESGCSLVPVTFANDSAHYVAVGTAFIYPDEEETSKGRLLIFQVRDGKLRVATETEVPGAPYTLNAFQGKLLAGINSRVQIFWMSRAEDGSQELLLETTHIGYITVLYLQSRGDFVLVGDLIRSVDVLVYKAEEGTLEFRARDYNAAWMMAVDFLDDDTYLGAENSHNLFTLRRNSDAANDEDRNRLEVIGEYHLGDQVNRFQHGSLVMQLAENESARIPTVLFGTISGAIGVVASLPPQLFKLLESLQRAIKTVIKGVGGLEHTAWRLFKHEHATRGCKNFLDGDLIEQFLDLRKEDMQKIVGQLPTSPTVEEMSRTIEELSRALH